MILNKFTRFKKCVLFFRFRRLPFVLHSSLKQNLVIMYKDVEDAQDPKIIEVLYRPVRET